MSKDPKRYQDMLDLPRPRSLRHQPMSRANRAAQFSPFAALTGYEELIEEGSRLTEQKKILEGEALEALNRSLQRLPLILNRNEVVELDYFEKDPFKPGGQYCHYQGRILKYDKTEAWLLLEGGRKLYFEDIVKFEI